MCGPAAGDLTNSVGMCVLSPSGLCRSDARTCPYIRCGLVCIDKLVSKFSDHQLGVRGLNHTWIYIVIDIQTFVASGQVISSLSLNPALYHLLATLGQDAR